ncbi:hypothetical protein SAMN00790413_04997 [Deinococcus hopiensis KR-140]|uniref:Uncharacterized protein n=1 Tax=Deinococcus hopiensis KR-140 TaxID=695939 RepID=A0A1W1UST5_9DEIO|nr:hypothetical protein SAMN00790413_04997 [Deinococcus hopiensis KR-140]
MYFNGQPIKGVGITEQGKTYVKLPCSDLKKAGAPMWQPHPRAARPPAHPNRFGDAEVNDPTAGAEVRKCGK